jgi:hypothetical protein
MGPQDPESQHHSAMRGAIPTAQQSWNSLISKESNDMLTSRYIKVRGFEPALIALIRFYESQLDLLSGSLHDLTPGNESDLKTADIFVDVLAKYTQLIEQMEAMEERRMGTKPSNEPSIDHRGLYRHAMCSVKGVRSEEEEGLAIFNDSITFRLSNFWRWLTGDSLRNFLHVASVAVTAGASILLPMIIMTFVPSIYWRLGIVSAAVIVFALGMSAASQSSDEVIAATAGYAAIMVVYIGSTDHE